MAMWVLKRNDLDVKELAKSANISETVATILSLRGLKTHQEIQQFLSCSLRDLHDAMLMKDMDKGTEIITQAI
jgi:single-stranded-DNA-specific exonuclease